MVEAKREGGRSSGEVARVPLGSCCYETHLKHNLSRQSKTPSIR